LGLKGLAGDESQKAGLVRAKIQPAGTIRAMQQFVSILNLQR